MHTKCNVKRKQQEKTKKIKGSRRRSKRKKEGIRNKNVKLKKKN